MVLGVVASAVAALLLLLGVRVYVVLAAMHSKRPRTQKREAPFHVAVFLGSGGHTGEMIRLLSALDPEQFPTRTYVLSAGDTNSLQHISRFEDQHQHSSSAKNYSIHYIPRARRVHQSYCTAPFSTLQALSGAFRIVYKLDADVFLMNGPGTCVPLCVALFVLKIFTVRGPEIIYIESWARTERLSLSAKLVRPFVDRFIVQWPRLSEKEHCWWRASAEYHGWLL